MPKIVLTALPGRQEQALPDLTTQFLDQMAVEGKRPATIQAYRKDLKAFTKGIAGPLAGVTHQVLAEHLKALKSAGGLAPATLARHRVSLRAFFGWAVVAGLLEKSPAECLPRIRLPDHQPRALNEADLWRVLRGIPDKRDQLFFFLLADTGMRVSEALSIRLEKIRLHAQEISVIGKRQRERTVYLIKTESLGLLKRHLRQHGWLARDGETIMEKGLLFRPAESKRRGGKAGAPVDYTVMQKAWKRYCAAAGVVGTIHQLRHSYATRLINKGVRMEEVQKILGHRNLQTTQRYAAVSDETVRAALERL